MTSTPRGGRRPGPVLAVAALGILGVAYAADIAGTVLDVPILWIAAWYLVPVGVAAGVLALLAAAADRRGARPPRRGRWRRGAGVLLQLLALTLLAVAWLLRGADAIPPDPAILLIAGVALALLAAGWWARRSASPPLR